MGQDRIPAKRAIVRFERAGEAGRRVAGIAAAARIVRDLAKAGVAEAWLALPPGDRLDAAAMADLDRLAGTIEVRLGEGGLPDGVEAEAALICLDGDRLVPSATAILKQTGKAGDGPVSRTLNRPISRFISGLLLHLPRVRPIHATVGTALLAAAMFGALLFGGTAGLIAGGLLFQAASIFDGVDGEIARATFRSSESGAMMDNVVDIATNLLFVLGVTVNLAASGDRLAPMLTAWGFALFLLGLAAVAWRASRSGSAFGFDVVKNHYRRRFPGHLVGLTIRFFIIVTSRDFFALLFALLILAGLPMGVLYLFAAAATIWILFVLGAIRIPAEATLAPKQA
jgi:CDP-L-myo-inositol myo-inositolphosphotransferase